jgi:hypothetical protein
MDMYYRNIGSVVVRFELNNQKYVVEPHQTVLIPEKYDYAIDLMQVKNLQKDQAISEWVELVENISDEELIPPMPPVQELPKRQRKRK